MTSEEFRTWRERLRLTQTEIAKLLEVTETTVYRWENGRAPISKAVELALKQIESEMKNA